MGVLEWILVVIRWGHALAAVAWVGGGVFWLMVLRPAIRRSKGIPPETGAAIRDEFRGLVTTAIAVLLLSGAILSVARLTSDAATVPYMIVLAVKIAAGALHVLRGAFHPARATTANSRAQVAAWVSASTGGRPAPLRY